MNRMEEILNRCRSLPPLPDTIMRLARVCNDPDSTVSDIVEAIRYDPAVTAEVLRLCNSAYLGLPRRIHSLNDAMRYLGTMRVLHLVMTLHGRDMLAGEQPGYGLAAGALWRHSVAVAIGSSIVGARLNLISRNMCFTAGLLHDIGKVILSEYVAAQFGEIIERVAGGAVSFVDAEREVLGFSHQEVGEKLAQTWCLPEAIARCIRYHHDPGELPEPDPLVDTVYLANCICLLLGIGLGSDELCYRADPAVMERYGLEEADLEIMGAQMLADLRGVEQVVSTLTHAARPASAGAFG